VVQDVGPEFKTQYHTHKKIIVARDLLVTDFRAFKLRSKDLLFRRIVNPEIVYKILDFYFYEYFFRASFPSPPSASHLA
jgi:hypothetical protein